MRFNEITQFYENDLQRVSENLRKNYQSDIPLAPRVAGHILGGGGKRIRPLLMFLSVNLCGREISDRVIEHCSVVEYVHAATLLHDDVVDETTVRRGNRTANSIWGSDASILMGDFLISRAILILAEDNDPKIFKAFAKSAKILVDGGLLELTHARDTQVSEEHCLDVIYKKTASVMSLSCQLGAILAQSDNETEDAMISFGKDFGMAFQLMDDVLDYDGTEEQLGKPVGTDFKEGHVTMPLLHLYQSGDKEMKREIESFVQNDKISRKDIEYIVERMHESKSFEYTVDKANEYMDSAKKNLHTVQQNSPRHYELIVGLMDFIVGRYTPSKRSLTPISDF
ncbi:MAG: polyprenyl synthetase family protein [Nitrospinales bacterium]